MLRKQKPIAVSAALLLLAAGLIVGQQKVTINVYAKAAVMAGEMGVAQQALDKYRAAAGQTPEYIEGLSWIGRGHLTHRNFAEAEKNAAAVRELAIAQLAKRPLDAEPHLPLALGAAIEVASQSLAGENRRDEAVLFLNDELKKWRGTSIHDRIQKNLNLLTLEGKPVPVLDVKQGLPGHVPQPLSAHLGHPVLLFMWAHWCSDCKNEIGIVKKLEQQYGPRGLVVVAPTQHYGYVAGGQDAPRDAETRYIGDVFAQYYASLGNVEVPVSEANFARFGVSTTPTMVIVDKKGIVRLYNPGNATYEQLAAKIEAALRG